MIRILLFLAGVVLIGTGLSWVASLSGNVVLRVGDTRIVISLFTALCALLVLISVILFVWWLLKTLIRSPRHLRQHFAGRRRERGYQLLGQGLIAVMSGDVKAARRLARQSNKLLEANQEPLLHLLTAETKRLEFDHEGAVEMFRIMCDDPKTQLIGLKGLYREAVKNGEEEEAGRLAATAAKMSPSLEWASHAGIASFARDGAWGEALLLLERHEKALSKSRRHELGLTHWRVVLMCAHARHLAETDLDQARDVAFKARALAAEFIPAATIAAQIAFRLGEQRKASKMIEILWQKTPHPDLAQCYIEASDGSPREKLNRAKKLARFNPDHYLSQMLVARTAFAAKDYLQAQKAAQAAAETTAFSSIFLLLADIEAALTGNQANIQHFLARALNAPADPVWIDDGQIMPQWVAISPINHHIGTCLWQQPVKAPTILTLDPAQEEAAPVQNLVISSPSKPAATPISSKQKTDKKARTHTQTTPVDRQEAKIVKEKPIDFLTDVEHIDPSVHPGKMDEKTLTRLVVDDPGIERA